MAFCPKCAHPLKIWNVKAECPYCGVNIPNYNWEERLDEDAKNAEIAWAKFRVFTGNFKSALFGSKLRIIRFIFTFVPLIALVLPLASYSVNLPFVSASGNMSLLDFTLNTLLNLNWGSLITLASSNILGTEFLMLFLSILLLYLAVVCGVLNFVFVLLRASKLKAGFNMTMCISSALCFAVSALLFTICVTQIGDTSVNVLSGSLQYGIFVGVGLFTINIILNTVVNKGFKKQRLQQAD